MRSLSLSHLRRRLPYGKTPFGFARVDGALVPIPERIDALRRISALRADGASYRQIVRWLEEPAYRQTRAVNAGIRRRCAIY